MSLYVNINSLPFISRVRVRGFGFKCFNFALLEVVANYTTLGKGFSVLFVKFVGKEIVARKFLYFQGMGMTSLLFKVGRCLIVMCRCGKKSWTSDSSYHFIIYFLVLPDPLGVDCSLSFNEGERVSVRIFITFHIANSYRGNSTYNFFWLNLEYQQSIMKRRNRIERRKSDMNYSWWD